MVNPFDQFDDINPFDQFDAKPVPTPNAPTEPALGLSVLGDMVARALPEDALVPIMPNDRRTVQGFGSDANVAAPAMPQGVGTAPLTDEQKMLAQIDKLLGTADTIREPNAFDQFDDNPEGTGFSRAVDRGVLRLQMTPEAMKQAANARLLADTHRTEQNLLSDMYLETTGMPAIPEGVDISTPEAAYQAVADIMGPSIANNFWGEYEIRKGNAASVQGEEAGTPIIDGVTPDSILQEGVAAGVRLNELGQEVANIPMSPTAAEYGREYAAAPENLSDALMTIWDNPLGAGAFFGETVAESVPILSATMATSLITRSPSLSRAMLSGGSFAQEYGTSYNEFLGENGVEMNTPEQALQVLQNEDLLRDAAERGAIRGLSIAAFEMLGQGLAAKSLFKGAVRNALVDTTIQAGTGAAGEAAAMGFSGQELSIKEILAEALGEMVTAPVEVGAAAIARNKPEQPTAQMPDDAPNISSVLDQLTQPSLNDTRDQTNMPATETAPQAGILPDQPAQPQSIAADPNAPVEPIQGGMQAPEAGVAPEVGGVGNALNTEAPNQPQSQAQPATPTVDTNGPTQQNPDPQTEEPVSTPAPEEAVEGEAPDQLETPARETEIISTPDNEPVEVETMVVEAGSVMTSDQEGYPQELQPRDRDRAASETQIEGIANNPNPQRLHQSPETDRGAPIISGDNGVVESGNGRIMGLRRAYERGSAAEYRAYVEENFPEAKGMTNPIIVRRRVSEVDQQQFTTASNTPATLQMSASENAQSDSRLIDQNVLSQYKGGGLANVGNRGMIRAFIGKLPKSVQGALVTSEGGLSVEGQRRFQNALFHRAYGDETLLNRLSEITDDDMRSVTGALADGAGQVAQVIAAIERGEVSPDTNIVSNIVEAIRQIADFRSKEMDLKGFRAQIDAFADPIDPITEKVMSAFFNEEGTRLVSKKAMQDFLADYANMAMEQKVDQETLPGVEPTPVKSGEEIVDEISKTEPADETGSLFEVGPEPSRKSPDFVGEEKQRTVNGESGKRASGNSRQKLDLKDAAPDELKKSPTTKKPQPKGSLAPTFLNFSFSDRNSVYEAAFRAAGIEPDKARLMSVDQQVAAIRKVILSKFGVRVEMPKRLVNKKTITGRKVQVERQTISYRDAIDQLLDAYRQMTMLAHVFGVPESAIGLKDKAGTAITLSLVGRLRGALGMYSGSDRSISLPGRSNSFSHEWGHALDHWLSGFLNDIPVSEAEQLFSRNVFDEGIKPGSTRSSEVAQNFIGLLQSLFGDSAKLAMMQIDLQQQATETLKNGKPSPKAKKAIAALKDIAAGKKLPDAVLNEYFKSSDEFDSMFGGKGYFSDPAEMLARAFETFAGVKASMVSDLPTSFLSKPDWAYTESEDLRSSMTFPRGVDAERIFLSIERLGDSLRKTEIFGTEGKALKPEDVDVFDMRHWDRWQPKGSAFSRERDAWYKSKETEKAKQAGPSKIQKIRDFGSYFANTFNGHMRNLQNRQPKEAQKPIMTLLDMFMKDPGSGRNTGVPWERAVESWSKRMTNRFEAISKNFKLHRLNKAEMKELRRLLTVPGSTSTNKNILGGAAALRRLMDDTWRYLDSSGVKIGYVKNGWLPRIIDMDVALAKSREFKTQAAKVYSIMFDRDVRQAELTDQISDVRRLTARLSKVNRSDDVGSTFRENLFSSDDTDTIKAWRKAVNKMNKAEANAKAAEKNGDGDAISNANAKLEEATEALLEIHSEVLDIMDRVFSEESARAWYTKIQMGGPMDFDTKGPDSTFTKKRELPAETDDLMIDFFSGDPLDIIQQYMQMAPRRAEYVKRDTDSDGKQGRIERLLENASSKGADGRDIREIRNSINMLSGRSSTVTHSASQWIGGWVYVAATVTLLKRAFYSSWAEPLSAGLRTGNTADSLRAISAFMGQLAHTGKSKDRVEMARIIGLVTSAQHESIMMNRFGGDLNPNSKQGKILANFFRYTLLTDLTNMQRMSMMAVSGHAIRRHLEAAINKKSKWSIEELNEIGIGEEHHQAMLDWLNEQDGPLPTADDMIGVDGGFYNDAAALYASATAELVQQIIQNPARYNRPAAAMDTKFRLMYGITGFIYAFHSNVIAPTFKRHIDERGENENIVKYAARSGMGSVRNLAIAAPSVAMLFTGHLLVTMVREALFNSEKWKELEEDDDDEALMDWLLERTFARTGLIGAWDIPYNLYTGVKYSRDLAGAYAGPHASWALSGVEDVIRLGSDRNSPNTNTAEWNAADSVLGWLTETGSSLLISSLPGGPITKPAYGGIMWGIDAMNPSETLADEMLGEKGDKHKKGEPKPFWELGD